MEDSYFGKTEVGNDYMPFLVKKYVLWLQVPEQIETLVMVTGEKVCLYL